MDGKGIGKPAVPALTGGSKRFLGDPDAETWNGRLFADCARLRWSGWRGKEWRNLAGSASREEETGTIQQHLCAGIQDLTLRLL